MLEKIERNKCLEDIETEIAENDNDTRRIVVIMGGDGMLPHMSIQQKDPLETRQINDK